jgi:hypothetical protein
MADISATRCSVETIRWCASRNPTSSTDVENCEFVDLVAIATADHKPRSPPSYVVHYPLAAVGGGGSNASVASPADTYTISGSVAGLATGAQVALFDNDGETRVRSMQMAHSRVPHQSHSRWLLRHRRYTARRADLFGN